MSCYEKGHVAFTLNFLSPWLMGTPIFDYFHSFHSFKSGTRKTERSVVAQISQNEKPRMSIDTSALKYKCSLVSTSTLDG